ILTLTLTPSSEEGSISLWGLIVSTSISSYSRLIISESDHIRVIVTTLADVNVGKLFPKIQHRMAGMHPTTTT
uniref:Uncharacterized protein n=1 Tax=Anopheles christyi TaxID=43041 RepID=A0A182KIB4_9DIPT